MEYNLISFLKNVVSITDARILNSGIWLILQKIVIILMIIYAQINI